MRKSIAVLSTTLFMTFSYCETTGIDIGHDQGYVLENMIDITDQIPVISLESDLSNSNWKFIPDVAHYKAADWSTCEAIAHGVTREAAKSYAESNSHITFFFYVKGYSMVLENTDSTPPKVRCFSYGDAVFFSGEPENTVRWGSAPGLADGYIKQ